MKLPRINVYQCEYSCHIVTIDVDKGVTPFLIKCVRKPTHDRPIEKKYLDEKGECKGQATSSFYPTSEKPPHIGEPTHEWYLPNKEEIQKFCEDDPDRKECILDYYNGEHLSLRERTDKEPIYHEG